MTHIIQELWHGNIVPQEDSRNNTKEMKELISYIARHDEDLEKLLTEEQKAIFEKYQDCWNEYVSPAQGAYIRSTTACGKEASIQDSPMAIERNSTSTQRHEKNAKRSLPR